MATSRTTHPPPLPSSVPHPQPLSPECPPGLRARSSARQNRGRRRRPGAEGRGQGASQTINRRCSRRRPPAKSTFRASTRFPLTKRPPPQMPGGGCPGCVAPAIAPEQAQLSARSRLSERREARRDKEAARLTDDAGGAATRKARAGGRRAPAPGWLTRRAASLSLSSLWWPGPTHLSRRPWDLGLLALPQTSSVGGQMPSGRLSC